jgi:V/A-type H+-transporting ATPase subunit A
LCADLINESFLRQSAFSAVDRFCSADKQAAMMQLIARFIELSENAVDQGVSVAAVAALPVMRRLRRMGEEIDDEALETLDQLRQELETDFTGLTRSTAGDAA